MNQATDLSVCCDIRIENLPRWVHPWTYDKDGLNCYIHHLFQTVSRYGKETAYAFYALLYSHQHYGGGIQSVGENAFGKFDGEVHNHPYDIFETVQLILPRFGVSHQIVDQNPDIVSQIIELLEDGVIPIVPGDSYETPYSPYYKRAHSITFVHIRGYDSIGNRFLFYGDEHLISFLKHRRILTRYGWQYDEFFMAAADLVKRVHSYNDTFYLFKNRLGMAAFEPTSLGMHHKRTLEQLREIFLNPKLLQDSLDVKENWLLNTPNLNNRSAIRYLSSQRILGDALTEILRCSTTQKQKLRTLAHITAESWAKYRIALVLYRLNSKSRSLDLVRSRVYESENSFWQHIALLIE